MTEYTTKTTAIVVTPKNSPICSEEATEVSIIDDGAGEFVHVEQVRSSGISGVIAINPDEWPTIRAAIDQMIDGCVTEAKP